jgi:hypothetical protein
MGPQVPIETDKIFAWAPMGAHERIDLSRDDSTKTDPHLSVCTQQRKLFAKTQPIDTQKKECYIRIVLQIVQTNFVHV